MDRVDDLVIGTGQAGKPLAGALAESGRRVVVVEAHDRVGGTCVLTGCTPTKAMVASARVAHLARRAADYGVEIGDVSIDLGRVRERKRTVVDDFSSGSRRGLEKHDTLELVFGFARFTGERRVEVDLRAGGRRTLEAERVFVNTGTRNRVLPLDGLDAVPWLDNASIMELDEVPEHLIVLGGGFIGLEFGQMFRRFGAEVTIVEAAGRLVGREDPEVSEALRKMLDDDGIAIRLDSRAAAVTRHGAGVRLTVETEAGEASIAGSHLLMAVGRVPATEGLGTDAAGIERTDRGFIRVNERLETTAEGVWALGDVNGGPPFTHIAYDDFRIVQRNLLEAAAPFGSGPATRDDRLVPYTLFTDPQLGRIGLTETQAREAGHAVRIAHLPMTRVARAIETDETRGFMKAVVDGDTDRILGAAILGPEGGEVATILQLAMMGDLPWTRLRDTALSHPTWGESLNNLFTTLE
ncbi:mercuric reductase [Gaopeijia maritima]|uniref:Mercuric reductase n=1 Tax=Gaopeijia maritima TaxID=3119007 RepID=A0ABU9EAB4_9BACT